MPRIDPLKLLTCLKVLLAENGGIKSAFEVKRLAGLMTKYSKKLVSKCIYIQILKCTETDLLGQFMGSGGWSLTHMWLTDGIRTANWPLVQEILELLLLCPVDVQRLRSNTAPKLVKGLCKDGGTEGVRILAAKLVEQWLKVVKGESMTQIQSSATSTATTITSTVNETINNAQAQNSVDTLPKHIIIESNKIPQKVKNSIVSETVSSAKIVENHSDEDSINVVGQQTSEETNQSEDEQKKTESTLVYRLVVKDGKQVLAKVLNPSKETLKKPKQINENDEVADVTDSVKMSEDENTNDMSSVNKDSDKIEKDSDKDIDNKDNKENKDKEKSKGSSKDKEKYRDHKSSNSSSHHKSSSSGSKSSTSKSSGSSSRSKSSSSSHKSSEKDKERDKHHRSSSNSSSGSSSKHKHEDRNKERSSKDKDRKDSKSGKDKEKLKTKEKEEDKEKEKADQAEKDKETLSKLVPTPLDKIGKIPKKPKDENNSSPTSNNTTSITIPSKKASMSIEIRKDSERPKTVKTYNSQFRSHGLTDEAPPPPSRKGLKKPASQPVPGTSIPSSLSLKRASPPPSSKDGASLEKKPKIEMTASNSPEKPGAIKLIAPKPKQSTLVESDMFMDALSASATIKKDSRKRKRRPSATKETLKEGATSKDGGSSPPESPSASPAEKVAPLKFYQDTLEDNKDEDKSSITFEDKDIVKLKDKDDDKNEDEDDIPLKRVKEAIDQKVQSEKDEDDENSNKDDDDNESDEPPAKKPPGPGCGPDGPPGVLMLHRRKGPKKKLSWKAPSELEEIRYFELDENERVNVTKPFVDMKHMERMNEREAFFLTRKLNNEDTMTEQTSWMPLILVDDVPPLPDGNQSKEKRIQAEREQTTLKALYFNRHMIPDSPAEPDMEQYQITEPAVIPLDDITGNPDAVNDFTSIPWPESKGSPPLHGENEFVGANDMGFQGNQFSPFMPFGQQQWQMQQAPQGVPPPHPNGVIPGNMMGPIGAFNNMNMNMPPNMMMGPKPDEMAMINMNMGIIAPLFAGTGANFNAPPNSGAFNNYVPPPGGNINMNQPNFSPPQNNQNMNRGGPRGGPMSGNNRGNWRSGAGVSNNQLGGNWRPQGPGVGSGGIGGNNWIHGNRSRICKQFQRGHCRNGSKCIYLHPIASHHRI